MGPPPTPSSSSPVTQIAKCRSSGPPIARTIDWSVASSGPNQRKPSVRIKSEFPSPPPTPHKPVKEEPPGSRPAATMRRRPSVCDLPSVRAMADEPTIAPRTPTRSPSLTHQPPAARMRQSRTTSAAPYRRHPPATFRHTQTPGPVFKDMSDGGSGPRRRTREGTMLDGTYDEPIDLEATPPPSPTLGIRSVARHATVDTRDQSEMPSLRLPSAAPSSLRMGSTCSELPPVFPDDEHQYDARRPARLARDHGHDRHGGDARRASELSILMTPMPALIAANSKAMVALVRDWDVLPDGDDDKEREAFEAGQGSRRGMTIMLSTLFGEAGDHRALALLNATLVHLDGGDQPKRRVIPRFGLFLKEAIQDLGEAELDDYPVRAQRLDKQAVWWAGHGLRLQQTVKARLAPSLSQADAARALRAMHHFWGSEVAAIREIMEDAVPDITTDDVLQALEVVWAASKALIAELW